MPLPLLLVPLVPWIASAIGVLTAAGAGTVSMTLVRRKFNEIGPAAIQASLDRMGLQIDATHPINDETLTAAINGSFLQGTGLELESIFDREKMRNGFKKLAVKKAAQQLGFADVNTEAGLHASVREWLTGEVMAQMAVDAGDVFDAAKESIRIQKAIKDAKKEVGWNTPTDFSKEGIANRARQAKYRRHHKKTWVEKGTK